MRRSTTMAAVLLLALSACSDDAEPKSAATTTTSTTELVGVDEEAYVESGDYVNGRHIAQLTAFTDTEVTFDVVQFLTGDAAKRAYKDDTGEEPDTDYYVRNQSKQLRTLPLSDDLSIRVNNTGGYEPSEPDDGHEVSWLTFDSYMKTANATQGYFWITIESGRVAAIEEQYVP